MSDTTNPDQQPVAETKQAVKQALTAIKTPEQADRVIDELERMAADKTAHAVAQRVPTPPASEEAAQRIEQASEAPLSERPQAVIAEAARQVAQTEGEDEQQISEGIHQATNPAASAIRAPETEQERQLLQEALLRRLGPISAADATIFLFINTKAPRSGMINGLMHLLTTVMNRGDGWVALLLLATLWNHRRGRRALLDVLPALWLTAATIEVPIKSVFRRRRPFISIVRAIVVGRKPGGYSFPSGHSAAAFGGAWLISRHYPRWTVPLYLVAALVGFSRVYLGVHYPGDVVTGGLSGVTLAVLYRKLCQELIEEIVD